MPIDYCQFVLLHEGPSDAGLVSTLETLLVEAGFDEVLGEARMKVGTVKDSLTSIADSGDFFHLIFVHRDADGAGRSARVAEISEAAANAAWAYGEEPHVVPVIPARMTEAWLLLDEIAIREVCGNRRGTTKLELPKAHEVEAIADPKATLFAALRDAAERGGRRRITIQELSSWRARLLERLDAHGPVRSLNAWKALEEDIAALWTARLDARGAV